VNADLRGLAISGLSRRVLDLLSSVAAVDKHHYPETLAACFLINPPASLSMVLRMVTPLINPATRRKVSAATQRSLTQVPHAVMCLHAVLRCCACALAASSAWHARARVMMRFRACFGARS
jgi:hypothetical protein